MNEYKELVKSYPRKGFGIEVHCHEVGLQDPSITANDALPQNEAPKAVAQPESAPITVPSSYDEWIKSEQQRRNAAWEKNVASKLAADTAKPAKFDKFSLFEEGAEQYALQHTTVAS